jgi:hypothetical protein
VGAGGSSAWGGGGRAAHARAELPGEHAAGPGRKDRGGAALAARGAAAHLNSGHASTKSGPAVACTSLRESFWSSTPRDASVLNSFTHTTAPTAAAAATAQSQPAGNAARPGSSAASTDVRPPAGTVAAAAAAMGAAARGGAGRWRGEPRQAGSCGAAAQRDTLLPLGVRLLLLLGPLLMLLLLRMSALLLHPLMLAAGGMARWAMASGWTARRPPAGLAGAPGRAASCMAPRDVLWRQPSCIGDARRPEDRLQRGNRRV